MSGWSATPRIVGLFCHGNDNHIHIFGSITESGLPGKEMTRRGNVYRCFFVSKGVNKEYYRLLTES